ncbi:MAG: hypothetical protein MUE51_15525 [Thermoleophilia bacterium]|nr:hypothetical protein [Thermoleophilia bacterium]
MATRAVVIGAVVALAGAGTAAGAPRPVTVEITGSVAQSCEQQVVGRVPGARTGAVVLESLATGRAVALGAGSVTPRGFEIQAELAGNPGICDQPATLVRGREQWWRVRFLGTPWARPATTPIYTRDSCGRTRVAGTLPSCARFAR